jgi:hypothetical protein
MLKYILREQRMSAVAQIGEKRFARGVWCSDQVQQIVFSLKSNSQGKAKVVAIFS